VSNFPVTPSDAGLTNALGKLADLERLLRYANSLDGLIDKVIESDLAVDALIFRTGSRSVGGVRNLQRK